MSLFIFIATLAQAHHGPTPLDAFRANHAAVKAEMDFVLEHGRIDSSFISGGTIWSTNTITMADINNTIDIIGTWACDGTTEYFYCGSPDAVIAKNRERLSKAKAPSGEVDLGYKPKRETLFDGDVMVDRLIDEPSDPYRGEISVRKNGNDILYVQGKGPYSWWECTFPYYLSYRFPNTVPRVVRLTRGLTLMDVEVYHQELANGWLQLEVAYDPAMGYVPRHTRLVSFSPKGKTFVRETYAIRVEPCKAGGFVPTEWYSARFDFDDFASRYPTYNESLDLAPSKSSVYVEHFRATRFKDRTDKVALVHVDGVHELVATGGTARLEKNLGPLNLPSIKSKLGRKLTQVMSNQLPSIDASELDEFKATPSPWWPWVAAAMFIILVGSASFRRLKARFMHALFVTATLISLNGCGARTPPVIKLTGRVEPSTFLFNKGPDPVKLKFVVRNEGTIPLTLLSSEGDCSCRQLDKSSFPITLRPSEEAVVPFGAQLSLASQIVTARFTFETPNGAIPVMASFHPLARHQFSPESAAYNSIVEDEAWGFELTHREIFRTNDHPEPVELAIPSAVSMRKTSTYTGLVAGAEGYSFTDETYRVDVTSREKGLHKEEIILTNPDRTKRAVCAVVWKRVPFLSSVPERVTLGKRPARAFLLCPDDAIELKRVLSTPPGVKAVVSSTRELTLMLADGFDGPINGTVEVSTTSHDHPLLSVPVVRYVSPTLSSKAEKRHQIQQ